MFSIFYESEHGLKPYFHYSLENFRPIYYLLHNLKKNYFGKSGSVVDFSSTFLFLSCVLVSKVVKQLLFLIQESYKNIYEQQNDDIYGNWLLQLIDIFLMYLLCQISDNDILIVSIFEHWITIL